MKFGFSTNTYGVGDLVAQVNAISEKTINDLVAQYEKLYAVSPVLKKGGKRHEELRYSARLELGMSAFLESVGAVAFTDTFEDLHGLRQLPGMATQRLMAAGYGFGGEGDWKTAILVRAMKVMAGGKLTSFMEDYTYHMSPKGHQVLGSHMLEICPTIASGKPKVEIHPLGIGGKEDPVRFVFDAPAGEALNASLVDLGNRFRLIVNEVTAVKPPALPKLPVARAVWECKPDFKTACQAWILAGGAHHTGYSYVVTSEMLEDFATIAGIETVHINAETRISQLKQDLRTNEVYYHLAQGVRA
jgi:L-arabinose isomerase